MKKVIVITGPTASGKTALSLKLAKCFNAEIINADAVQVYEKLDIGSAKVKIEERIVPHHLFDVVKPNEDYTVFDYQKDARSIIDKINIPMFVGGSGLYIKSALFDYEFKEMENVQTFDELSNEEIYNLIIEKNPNIEVDKFNRRRLVSLLNRMNNDENGVVKTNKNKPLYNILAIYLDLPREVQTDLFKKRLDIQLEEGFIEETKMLRNDNIHLNIIGYKELDMYLNGDCSLEEAKEAIILKTRKLAKKQKTWFLNQMAPHVFNALDEDLFEKTKKLIEDFLKEDL